LKEYGNRLHTGIVRDGPPQLLTRRASPELLVFG
jgi:hypothetical protein